MKLVGELKKQVEETKNKEEAKDILEKAGMELSDEELDQVVGGMNIITIKSPKLFSTLLEKFKKIFG